MTDYLDVLLLDKDAKLPKRNHETDAGLDLYAAEDVTIAPYCCFSNQESIAENYRVIVKTGIVVKLPPGSGMFIWDRSGLAAKHGLHCLGGVVDEGYTGEIGVIMTNLSNREYHITKGDRIAQAVILPILKPEIRQVNSLESTDRASSGFGSSGR